MAPRRASPTPDLAARRASNEATATPPRSTASRSRSRAACAPASTSSSCSTRRSRRYGSERIARQYVNTPDRSTHVTGKAVDIGPTDAAYWLAQHGARYGLCQIYANEIWHFERVIEPGGTCPRSNCRTRAVRRSERDRSSRHNRRPSIERFAQGSVRKGPHKSLQGGERRDDGLGTHRALGRVPGTREAPEELRRTRDDLLPRRTTWPSSSSPATRPTSWASRSTKG